VRRTSPPARPAAVRATQLADGAIQLSTGIGSLATGTSGLASGLHQAADSLPKRTDSQASSLAEVVADPVEADTSGGMFGPTAIPLLAAVVLWFGGLVSFLVMRAFTARALTSRRPSALLALRAFAPAAALGAGRACWWRSWSRSSRSTTRRAGGASPASPCWRAWPSPP
jgi:putative membrane protein